MTREERIHELMEKMTSFSKEKYQKSELLNEMFALQQEMVEITFNGEHASTADLKIWDVERHLEQMNRDCGNVADDALQTFKSESKAFCNLIKAEVSGARGEARAFRTLQFIRNKNIVLKNVEMRDGDLRTELDAIVIMPGTIVIVEVKNTAKDIFIDENGDYYRVGEYLKRDCNIAEKMMIKENMLRKTLESEGILDVPIRSIVVFTDNRIEVQNKYPRIKTCFVSQLAYIIDGFSDDCTMTDEEMKRAENAIRETANKEAYPFKFDVQQYKRDFAALMATLEEASAANEEKTQNEMVVDERRVGAWDLVKRILKSKYVGYAGSAAAAAVVTFASTVAVSVVKKGGICK